MNERMAERISRWSVVTLAVIAAAGCVPVDSSGTEGAGGSGGGGTTTSGPLDGTDAQVCGAACDTLIGCGIELDQAGCKESCLAPAGANLVSCFRSVDASCNSLSSCVLGTVCGSGGVPAGGSSCGSGEDCLTFCAGSNDGSCGCACMGDVKSGDAAAIYAVAVCVSVHCNFECGGSGDATSCDSCLALECQGADADCQ